MAASPLPYSSIENHFLKLDYLTTTGPRIVGLFAAGIGGNLLAETPNMHWSTPHGEYYLHGVIVFGLRLVKVQSWKKPGRFLWGEHSEIFEVPWIP